MAPMYLELLFVIDGRWNRHPGLADEDCSRLRLPDLEQQGFNSVDTSIERPPSTARESPGLEAEEECRIIG
jgi:hypothetical protein